MTYVPLPEQQDVVYVGDGRELPRCEAKNNRGFRCEKPARKGHKTCVVHMRHSGGTGPKQDPGEWFRNSARKR